MRVNRLVHIILMLSVAMSAYADVSGYAAACISADSVSDMIGRELEEVNVVALKQERILRDEALSASVIGADALENVGVDQIKGISNVVPNFYMPDYGSRITSSIYVRGIGARMDQPAVGLNVDNVPYMNKNAYDFDIGDIASVEMLRGPQSTLYGRNTMGGLINVTTLSPMHFQGWRLMAEAGNGNRWYLSAGWYAKHHTNFATSINATYSYLGGYFRNQYSGKLLDYEQSGSVRWKSRWNVSKSVHLQNVLTFSVLRQGGYPYEYIKTGEINYNDTCCYRRTTVADGLTMTWRGDKVSLSSVTTAQYLDDSMTLDQDFLPLSFFNLTQAQKEVSITEDFLLKGNSDGESYKWLAGLFFFYKHLDMDAPVTFKDDGIREMIENNRNNANPGRPIKWDTRQFDLGSAFTIPTYGVALYHESKYSIGEWRLSVGLRLDYERTALQYHSFCQTGYNIYNKEADGALTFDRHAAFNLDERGDLHRHYINWMPRVSALRNFGETGNVYASVSKGYKAGGFNTQMFSEVLQQRLMRFMGIGLQHDVNTIVGYKPEWSWNYEVGTHLSFMDSKLTSDISLFYIDCHDQQMTTFPDGTTTGRIMTNAGRTRSYGSELSVMFNPVPQFCLTANYGLTQAKFIKYNDGRQDYKGKYVPYAPANTLFLMAAYEWPMKKKLGMENISAEANMRGTGRIYWNESNLQRQDFYALLAASVTMQWPRVSLRIWGENLTNTKYYTFYFMSMGNEFRQRGKPIRFGASLRINI